MDVETRFKHLITDSFSDELYWLPRGDVIAVLQEDKTTDRDRYQLTLRNSNGAIQAKIDRVAYS